MKTSLTSFGWDWRTCRRLFSRKAHMLHWYVLNVMIETGASAGPLMWLRPSKSAPKAAGVAAEWTSRQGIAVTCGVPAGMGRVAEAVGATGELGCGGFVP